MEKKSDVQDILSGIGNKARGAAGAMSGWYQGLSPDVRSAMTGGLVGADVRSAMTRGLVGAGTGAALLGGLSAMSAHADPEHRHHVKGQALLGALMGGTAAAGLPVGLKMLSGGVNFSGESEKPLVARGGDKLLSTGLKNPAALVLGGVAALGPGSGRNREVWGQLADTVRESTRMGVPALQRIKDALHIMAERHAAEKDLTGPAYASLVKADKATSPAAKAILARFEAAGARGGHIARGRLAAIPAAIGGGLLLDKYLRGEY